MKTKIRILYIDDNLHDRQIVKEVLQQDPYEFEVIETDGLPEFEQHLSKSDFDFILSEINLPGLDGLKVLQIVKKKKTEIPVIIVTGKGSEEIAVEAMKLGAADYVIKSEKHIQNLTPTIRKVIENRKIQGEHNATLIALRKSEERFRLLFDNSIDAVLLTKPDGAILAANTAACTIFGRTEEGLKQVGRNGIIDITDPRLAIGIEERSRTGKYHGELTGLHKDGTPFPIEISSSIFLDSEGSQRTSMTIRDISVRKLRENKLQDNERKLKEAQELAHLGFWIWDIKTGEIEWSDEVFKIFCIDPKEFTPKVDSILALSPWPEDNQRDQELIKKAIDTHSPGYYEQKFLRPDKSIGYYYSTFQGNFDENNNLISIFGTVLDITERKLTEKRIQENNSRLGLAMQAANMAWWEMDMVTGNVIFEKQKAEMLGYSSEKFKHYKDFMALVHPDDYDKTMNAMQGHIDGLLDKYEIEYRILTKSGEYKWFYDVGSITKKDSKGTPLSVAGIVIDISDRKQSEKLLIASEIRYRRLFESAKDGILILDAETGMIADVNPYLVKLLGYSTEQFHGKKIWEIGIFSDIIANQEKFIELQQNEYVRYDDLPLKTIDGRQIDVEFVSNVYEVNQRRVIQCNIRNITERKKLEEQRIIQTTALKAAAFSVLITNAEGIIIWVNNAFSMMTGYSKEEAIGKSPSILKSGKHDKSFFKNMWDTIKAGNVWHGEIINKRKDGSLLIDEMTITPVLDKNGIVRNFIALKQDITERKRERETLIESENLLSSTQKFAHIGSFNYFLNSNELKWSDELYNILGLQRDTFKVSAESFINCIHPDDRTSMQKWIEQTSSGINTEDLDFRIVKPDGTIRNIYGSGKLQRDTDGKAHHIIGSAQDITERKNTEKALKESEEKFRSLLENSADAIFITNPLGKYIYTNKAVTDLLGYSSEEMLRKTIADLAPKDKIESYFEMFKVVLNKSKYFGELELLKNDGNFVSTDLNAVLLPDGSVYGSCRDITESKKAKEEIRNLNANLELKVEERTKKLTEVNINLIEAKAQAEQANKSKSQFLANMSHEIRTPMNAVLGYSELLGSMVEDKTQKDYVESIKSSGRSLLTLINDILDLSKIEADKMELEFDYVKTSTFFSEFERIFSLKISEKGLEFMLDIDSETPAGIYIDEARLRQILLNLIGNAVKFTKKGHIKLRVYTENLQILNYTDGKSDELINLVIEIEDTGIGISKEFQEKIFEPFTQQSGQQKYGGTGLGLAISQRLVKLMNGTITLQSELRKGSTFRIMFHEIKYLRNFENEKNEIQINTANIEFEKATILVVDDVGHNRKYLADALKNKNITVLEAENGLLAYKLAKEKIPDLIISDIGMPKLDGFGLLNKIKTDKTLKHIPVIAYSASVMKGQKEKINKSEFAGLLTKPVQVSELYIELLNYLPYKQNKTEIPETAGKIEFKELSISELTIPEFAKDFNSQVLPIWKSVKERRSQKLVADLSTKMQELGEKYNSKNSTEFGSMLKIANDSFNVEEVRSLLKRFEIFENNFKKHKNE